MSQAGPTTVGARKALGSSGKAVSHLVLEAAVKFADSKFQ